ncbi:MbeD family mobilization/exclusion protein [Paenalcaligenes hominis]|uniref:MbeD family mobilization/exclusion protein n=1 Tax=Enterobacteriaceae TaxID=543 RepID=UPI000E5B4F5E|nr:MbeD family mobilization/exclusion protein [Salmonella enterica]EFV4056390.1 MbeD family mobilization/exclusion protein [Salmonella enterica]EFV4056597.1 MbeD family mobilization/exclusion protein [Salmonella enterica]
MTELEKHLQNAFKRLEAHYSEQQTALNQAQSDLRKMFGHISLENQNLQKQVSSLTEQVISLSEQVQQLARLYSTSKR